MGLSAFGGFLRRTELGWCWADGRVEPRARDLTADEVYLYPRLVSARPDGSVARVVELPPDATKEEPTLEALLRLAGDQSVPSRDRPGAWEIPEALWDAWATDTIVGVAWDAADEPDLLALARSLGAPVP
jgi:hypothetical protein